jgi:hypothetical protein
MLAHSTSFHFTSPCSNAVYRKLAETGEWIIACCPHIVLEKAGSMGVK